MKRSMTLFFLISFITLSPFCYAESNPQGMAAKISRETGANNVWQEWIFPAASIIMLAVGLTVVGLNQGSPPDTSSSTSH